MEAMPSPSSLLAPTEPIDDAADAVGVRMRDGARLETDLYLPRPLGRRVPAVLVRLPYGIREPSRG